MTNNRSGAHVDYWGSGQNGNGRKGNKCNRKKGKWKIGEVAIS